MAHATVYKGGRPEPADRFSPGGLRVLPRQVLEGEAGGKCGPWRGCSRAGPSSTYRGPVRPDLPLTADLELAGAGGLGLLQVLAAVGLHRQASVGVHLAAQNLAMLHAQAAGFAALGPLPDVPAGSGRREGQGQITPVNRKRQALS